MCAENRKDMFRAACGKRVFNARPVRPSPVNCRLFSSDSVKTEFQQKLRTEGFTDVQAETAIKCLHKMIDERYSSDQSLAEGFMMRNIA